MGDFDAVFKAYDIRGVVPDQLDASMCRSIGAAFGRFAATPRVLIARDMRPSGVELSAAFAEGVRSQGVDVVDLGMASTDLIYYAAGRLDAPGAMFTASHNPAQYNGIKLCLAGAKPVGEDTGLHEIKAMAVAGLDAADHQGTITHQDLLEDFAAHVRSFVDVSVLKPLKVIADTANGMGGLVVPIVFKPLPFDLEVMYGELDGTFPNHPADPIQVENLRDLVARVNATGADVGLAFDGDADRVFLVDDKGVPASGSTTTAILPPRCSRGTRAYDRPTTASCSKAVPEIILANGGTLIRTRPGTPSSRRSWPRSGRSSVASIHALLLPRQTVPTRDRSPRVVVLEELSTAGVPLSELRKPFERAARVGRDQHRSRLTPLAVIEGVAAGVHGRPSSVTVSTG